MRNENAYRKIEYLIINKYPLWNQEEIYINIDDRSSIVPIIQ